MSDAIGAPVVLPPWRLEGRGIILVLKGGKGGGARPPAFLILADYDRSTAGPYGELLYIPGAIKGADGRRYLTIPQIVVSTEPAMTGGIINWGTPKTLVTARFGYEGRAVQAAIDDTQGALCRLKLKTKRWLPPVPVTTSLLPSALRRFEQKLNAKRYRFTPSASGWLRAATVESLTVEDRFVPGIDRDQVLAAFFAPKFSLTFPVASSIENL